MSTSLISKVTSSRPRPTEGYIRTYRNHKFYYNDLENSVIDIEDIAHALSQQCRWSGHTKFFYSVAQHSVYCEQKAPRPVAFEALMHDAPEAYVLDMPTPLKRMLPDYKEKISVIEKYISDIYNIAYPMSDDCRYVDTQMLVTEWNQLFDYTDIVLDVDPEVYNGYTDLKIEQWSPRKAEEMFLETFKKYV